MTGNRIKDKKYLINLLNLTPKEVVYKCMFFLFFSSKKCINMYTTDDYTILCEWSKSVQSTVTL